jgi:hypothetical protein
MKQCQCLPSVDLEETDSIAAWCVDGTVLWFGLTIENALLERINRGTKEHPKMEPRYTLAQLLDPDFRLPRPLPQPKTSQQQDGFAMLLAMASQPGSGVKRWEYVKPS